MNAAEGNRKEKARDESGISGNVLFFFALIFFAIVLVNFISIYKMIPKDITAKATSSQIKFCVGPPSSADFIYPRDGYILNGTEQIVVWATNMYSLDTVRNVSMGATLGSNMYSFGVSPYSGNTKYVKDVDTTLLPDANCKYSFFAKAESVCEFNLVFANGITINNIDEPPKWDSYKNNLTTNFSLFSKWTAIPDATIGKPGLGLINFSGKTINFDNADLDSNVIIENNSISVMADEEACLQGRARLSFYNIDFISPKPMLNGADCGSDICLARTFENGTYSFNVSRLSLDSPFYFSVAENMTPIVQLSDDTDKFERFIRQNITFYANFTTANKIILNSSPYYCAVRFNESINYTAPVNMTYNSTTTFYEYTRSFTKTGVHAWEVTCYSPILEITSTTANDTFLITNRPPIQTAIIPNLTWRENTELSGLMLNDYFTDPDEEPLTYDASLVPHIKINISNTSMVKFIPDWVWYGNGTTRFYAHDPADLIAESNEVLLTVIYVPPPTPGEDSKSTGISSCIPRWNCSEWGPCLYSGIQLRACSDMQLCGSEKTKPIEYQHCYYYPTCFDLIKNNDETGVDCGGTCKECPSCSDLIQNQMEEGVDCGGPCLPCASCNDGIINQNETGVDCGGPCQSCSHIEMPAYLNKKPEILFFFVAAMSLLAVAAGAFRAIAFARKKIQESQPKESALDIAEEKAVLQLEALYRHAPQKTSKECAKALSFEIREFFRKGFGLKYEFTSDELAVELRKLPVDANLKIAALSLMKKLEAIEFSGFRIKKEEIYEMIKHARKIIIELARQADSAKIKNTLINIDEKASSEMHAEEKQEHRTGIENISNLLDEGLSSAKSGNLDAAKEAYRKINAVYSTLSDESKQAIKPSIIELYKMIERLGQHTSEKNTLKASTTKKAGIALVILGIMIAAMLLPKSPIFGRKIAITGYEFVCTGDICFSPNPTDLIFNQSDNVTVYVYVTNPYDENISFDTFSGNPLFSRADIEKINNTAGKIVFSPTNDEVGNNTVTIAVFKTLFNTTDRILQDQKSLIYTVLNINDPPNVTDWYPPEDNPNIPENDSLGFRFNYTASDPDIKYGDWLTSRWYIDGALNATNQSILDYITGFCDAGTHYLAVIVNDSQNLGAFHNWTVSITNVNRPPALNESIGNFSWNEDSSLRNAFDLDDYFYDLDAMQCSGANKDNLTFSAQLSNGSESQTIVDIDSLSHVVNFSAPTDWCGNENINLIANDYHSLTYSNNVTLSVNCTPDSPVLAPIGNQSLKAETDFLLYISASDADIPHGDYLNFSANDTSLFEIITINATSASAVINFTPQNSQLGVFKIRISATDSFGLSAYEDVTFNITENHAPVINAIPNQSISEGSRFELQASASDADGDSFDFAGYSNNTFAGFSISPSGLINFTVPQNAVGNHTITLTATDVWGASSNKTFKVEINNTNQPPVLGNISGRRAKINHEFIMMINAVDPDIPYGDSLLFEINDTSLFTLQIYNESAVLINFSPAAWQIANYSFRINVTDASGETDSADFNLTVEYNHVPQIETDYLNATENDNFYFDISEYTVDIDNDSLTFSAAVINGSSTFPHFGISSKGLMDFSLNKSDAGNHSINITVSDGDNSSSKILLFEVFEINNPPVLLPIGNLTAYEDHEFALQLNATDVEGDPFEFVYALNGSFPAFSMSTSGLINFTPSVSQVGTHFVNITVRQLSNLSELDWEMVKIEVLHWNHPPNITYYYPILKAQTIYENESIDFKQNSTDFDNDMLNYSWLIDSVVNATTENWTYSPGYFGAGLHNITFRVSDSINSSSVSWTVDVLNLNRAPYFGNYSEKYSAFINSTNYSGITLNESAIILSENSSNYSLAGTFISQIIDFREDNIDYPRFVIKSANYYGTVPDGTNAYLYLRTSEDRTSWSAWKSCNTSCANITTDRYAQYMLNLSSSDGLKSPNITEVTISYLVSNLTLPENLNLWWISLPNFFNDPDYENMTYSYSLITGQGFINVTISPSGRVQLKPLADGNASIIFSAKDPYNETVLSNNFTVVIENVETVVPISQSTGGGGSSTLIINNNITKESPYAMNILVPEPITLYKNETIVAPIRIVNSGNVTLKNIKLSASAENKALNLTLTKDTIPELLPGKEEKTSVIIESYQLFGSYEVIISASVASPKFNETNKIFINSLEQGSPGENAINTKIAYTRDLLSQNTECLELNEFIGTAQEEIDSKEYATASQTLDEIIRNCKYLTTEAKRVYETPKRFSFLLNKNLLVGISALAILLILSTAVIIYTKKKFR